MTQRYVADAAAKQRRAAEADHIREELVRRVEDLAARLLPDGRLHKTNGEWRDGARGSKCIVLTGRNRGLYRDFEGSDKSTDLIGAIAELVTNGNMRAAFDWARDYLGIESANAKAIEAARLRSDKRRKDSEQDAAHHIEKMRRAATGLWHGADPIEGTLADRYLAGRGIDIRRLERIPGVLRYSPKVYCAERQGQHPAMLASLWRMGDPKMVACHRTYLEERAGVVDKAGVAAPRSTLGSWPGAIIPLARGDSGRRWRDIEEDELVAFGEGIEEGLSVALVKPSWRVGCVGFVGNFRQITLPVPCHVALCVNNDPEGSRAWKELYGDRETGLIGAVDVLAGRGHEVMVVRPPAAFKDWNDLLRGKRRDK